MDSKQQTKDMGYANGMSSEQWNECQKLIDEAVAAGVKCVETSCGRCCTKYYYEGFVTYKVDSSD